MSSILVKSVSAVMALSIAVPTFAAESWYERHAEGWHWYNDPEKIGSSRKSVERGLDF